MPMDTNAKALIYSGSGMAVNVCIIILLSIKNL